MNKKSLAGWVFRIEVVTNKPSVPTKEMLARLLKSLRSVEDVEMVAVEELFEDLKLFQKKEVKA